MLKFMSWKKKDKWLFVLTLGVILCILALPTGSNRTLTEKSRVALEPADIGNIDRDAKDNAAGNAENAAIEATARPSGTYEQELESRVREILRHVEGVGAVDVMIVLKSSGEKVIHVDGSSSHSVTEEKDTGGGTRKIENDEQEQNTVLTNADGTSAPVIAKELRPEISGIMISAAGGGSPVVRAEISAAMEALFDLPPHKIKVLKRVE